jgi:predicted GNAT family acetyltransferase
MQVRVIDDPAAFLEEAGPLLLADEARHNLLLALAATLRDHPEVYPDFRLWLVEDEGDAVGAALRTPPNNLVLARASSQAALEALAESLDDELPGIVGALPEAEQFAHAWATRNGVTPRRRMAQGVYALEQVVPITGVPGTMRFATIQDRAQVLDWFLAFAREVLPPESDEEVLARGVDHRLSSDDAGVALWEHNGLVSLAGFGGPTPNGIRIGPVYTPPELRGRGYASALVAELSAGLLAGGRRFCFLYTDLANPTSNKIYERIGYVRVCESAEIEFIDQTQKTK